MIPNKLNTPEMLKVLEPENLVVLTDFGSTIYGTALVGSDSDYKGIFLPKGRDIILGSAPSTRSYNSNKKSSGERNSAEDIDLELFSLYRYLELLSQGQTVVLDMLFCPKKHIHSKSSVWDFIVENKNMFLNKKCGAAIGYARAQANKYSLRGVRMKVLEYVCKALMQEMHSPQMPLSQALDKLDFFNELPQEFEPFVESFSEDGSCFPTNYLVVCGKKAGFTSSVKAAYQMFQRDLDAYGDRARAAMENGADWKAMYHAVRIAEQTVELLETGHITFPRPEAPLLLKIRKGELPVQAVSEMIEEGISRILIAQEKSPLPDTSNKSHVDDFIYSCYLGIVNERNVL